jgi:hypothetical protein
MILKLKIVNGNIFREICKKKHNSLDISMCLRSLFPNHGLDFDFALTFDGDVHFQILFHRLKTPTVNFRSKVKGTAKMDITIENYKHFELTS